MLLITSPFGSVRRKNQSLLHCFQLAVFLIKVKSKRQPVALVEVVHVDGLLQFVEQLSATYPQQDRLSDAGSRIGVVQVVRNGARDIVIFGNVGGQEKHRSRTESIGMEEVSLHKHL